MAHSLRDHSETAIKAVLAFFEEVNVAGLELPDGWYGERAWDNAHELTFSAARPWRLILELDEHLLLTFDGPTETRRETTAASDGLGTSLLVIDGFSQLVFDSRAYGRDDWNATVYRGGVAKFAAMRP